MRRAGTEPPLRPAGMLSAAVVVLVAAGWILGARRPSPALETGSPPPAAWRDELLAARALHAATAEVVWPGWTAPFDVLLLDGARELLIGRQPAPPGFEPAGVDPVLGPLVSRPPILPPQLLATMPLFGPPPTVVVGSPEVAGRTATDWQLMLLHEHFHQWQMRDAAYYDEVSILGLDRGDTSGRWMLDYPFPYDDAAVGEAFAALSRRLGGLLRRGADADLGEAAAAFWRDHGALGSMVETGAARYLDFQLWQEGVARFVELRVAEEGAARRTAGGDLAEEGLAALPAAARAAGERLLAELEAPDLAGRRRVSFYAYGAGLALLLERTDPTWKTRYETPRFRLAPAAPLD